MANVHKRVHGSQFKRERNTQNDERPPAKPSHTRIPVQGACSVLDAIGDEDVKTALDILAYNPRYASDVIKKLAESAIISTENNNNLQTDKPYVAECHASNGPVVKRAHLGTQGRAYRIFKRVDHVTAVLDER